MALAADKKGLLRRIKDQKLIYIPHDRTIEALLSTFYQNINLKAIFAEYKGVVCVKR